MEFKKYLENAKAQKQIDKLSKKFAGKKVAIYGAGRFCRAIFENYDLSGLNIVAIADIKFESEEKRDFFNLNCITPEELKSFDCDVILLGVKDTFYFLDVIENLLSDSHNVEKPVRPIIKQSFFGYIKSLFSDEY